MALWLLKWIGDGPMYDVACGFVVSAPSETQARFLAALSGGDEQPFHDSYSKKSPRGGWLYDENAICQSLNDSEPHGVVLRDFNAG